MNFKSFCSLLLFVILCQSIIIDAKRIRLRPLSASEVYRILKEYGKEDAVPEGRIISRGISAMKGFALGLTKGIVIPLAAGLAASAMNLTSLLGGSSSATVTFSQQEICFSSRNADGDGRRATRPRIITSDAPQGRQDTPTTTTTTTDITNPETVTTPDIVDTNTATGTATDADTGDNAATATQTTTEADNEAVNCIVLEKPNVG